MSASPFDPCQKYAERLVDSGDAASDPDLAAHLGTCLGCFRVATELRDAPRVAALLRQAEAAARQREPQPDERFWTEMSSRVLEAWPPARAEATRAVLARRPVAAEVVPSFAARLWAWLRMPIPAAACGAAAAVLVISTLGALGDRATSPARGPVPVAVQSSPPGAGTKAERGEPELENQKLFEELPAAEPLGPEDVALAQTEEVIDALGELDAVGLNTLLAGLDDELLAWPQGGEGNGEDTAEVETPFGTGSDLTDVAQDLDELDVSGLMALRDELEMNI